LLKAFNHELRLFDREIEITRRVIARKTIVSKIVSRKKTTPEYLWVWPTTQKEVWSMIEPLEVQGPIIAVHVDNHRKVNTIIASREW
jgi:hypothetical protein